MRTGLGVVGFALALCGCGARVDDNHTGGKTSWLSACQDAIDCSGLEDAVCASSLCTQACQSSCSLEGTSCVTFLASGASDDEVTQACLPQCSRDAECAGYGSQYTCDVNVCVLGNGSVIASEQAVSSSDASTLPSPVHDIAGVVLLDDGEDGDDRPLSNEEPPVGFDSAGYWHSYDDLAQCMIADLPNLDEMATLTPAVGSTFRTTPYEALGLLPPPEVLPNAPVNARGFHLAGGGHEFYGAGFGFEFETAYGSGNPGIDLQAAGYTGVRFWVYSPVATGLLVKVQDAYSIPETGLCIPRGPYPECEGEENCINAPLAVVEMGPEWRLYEVYFADVEDDSTTAAIELGPFVRSNWKGVDVAGNEIKNIPSTPERIFRLEFQTVAAEGAEGSFEFIIDNVGFIEANGPEDNAAGRFEP